MSINLGTVRIWLVGRSKHHHTHEEGRNWRVVCIVNMFAIIYITYMNYKNTYHILYLSLCTCSCRAGVVIRAFTVTSMDWSPVLASIALDSLARGAWRALHDRRGLEIPSDSLTWKWMAPAVWSSDFMVFLLGQAVHFHVRCWAECRSLQLLFSQRKRAWSELRGIWSLAEKQRTPRVGSAPVAVRPFKSWFEADGRVS